MVRSEIYAYQTRGRNLVAERSTVTAALHVIQDPIRLMEWVAWLALFMSVMSLIVTSR
jgi:hypothetical protein